MLFSKECLRLIFSCKCFCLNSDRNGLVLILSFYHFIVLLTLNKFQEQDFTSHVCMYTLAGGVDLIRINRFAAECSWSIVKNHTAEAALLSAIREVFRRKSRFWVCMDPSNVGGFDNIYIDLII